MTSGEDSISHTTSGKSVAEEGEMSMDIRAFSGDHERETEIQLRTKPLPRRRLVGPVFLILFVSFASIIGFLWLSTRGLNEDALVRDSVLVDSLLEVEASTLNRLAEIGARNYMNLVSALESRDLVRAERELALMSREMSGLGQIWFVAKNGEILLGTKQSVILKQPRDDGFARQLSDLTLQATLPAANQARSFLRDEDNLYLAVARSFSSFGRGSNLDPENFIVLLRPLDSEFFGLPAFRRSGLTKMSAGGEMGVGYSSLPLRAPDGSIIGYANWVPDQPGDLLIWPLSPAFALGLIAIGYFLFLFVRRADLFVERQAYLAAALQQEQNVRDLKMRFVSMISHELRTPLASIRSAAELVERYGDRMTEQDKEEELQVIHRSVDTLVRLIDNVVLVGKSDWLGNPGTKASIDLVDFCQQVWDEANYGSTSHRLLISEEGRRQPLLVDTSYLRALLSNLLQNAIKYSPGRREVMVTVFYRPREIVVRITDFGIGISDEDLKNIFDPFMRGRNAESFAGSGLGLAIAKASAEALGGIIGVNSKAGGGTTFEITFPLGRQAVKS